MPLRRPATRLEERGDQAMVQRLREYYDWGQQIHAICTRDGVTIDEAIARLGRSESRSTIYKAREFARWSRADLAYVLAERRGGRPLSWSHVIALVSVEDVQERRRLMRAAVAHGWSAARLRTEIRPGENLRSNSGRRFQGLERPEDVFRALDGYFQTGSPPLSRAQRRRLGKLLAALEAVRSR